jgi:hypothetical protein
MTRFPRWVPQSVKGKIADLQSSDLSAESREALERLATRDEMRGVWTKLPPESDPGDTILWFITAFVLAQGLEPPRPKDGMTLMEHIHLHWKPDCLGLAVLARHLLDQINKLGFPTFIRERWAEACPSESFERSLLRIEELASFFERLDREGREIQAILAAPAPPRKRGGESARQVYFSSILSNWFTRRYGRPFDDIVATVESVVFNLPRDEVVTGETIRGRRRRAPEHSRSKPPQSSVRGSG